MPSLQPWCKGKYPVLVLVSSQIIDRIEAAVLADCQQAHLRTLLCNYLS